MQSPTEPPTCSVPVLAPFLLRAAYGGGGGGGEAFYSESELRPGQKNEVRAWRVSKASFQTFQATGTITRRDARPLLQEAPGSMQGSLGCKDSRLEATWGVMRMKGSVEGVEHTDRDKGYLGHMVGECKGPKEESQRAAFLHQGLRGKAGLLNMDSEWAS